MTLLLGSGDAGGGGGRGCGDESGGGGAGRVTRYPISISRKTISILSSPISLAHIPYRYAG
jgi:hypothetical protein